MIPTLYKGTGYWVINKPSGLITTPTLDLKRPSVQSELNGSCPHRLDVGTSGCLIVTFDVKVFTYFTEQFQRLEIKKTYWAWCALQSGHLKSWRVENFLKPVRKNGVERMSETKSGGQKAITDFKVLVEKNRTALIECKPLTGRKHQIRTHLATSYSPILGDQMYGNPQAQGRLALHARQIEFIDPEGKIVSVSAPCK